MSRADFIIKHDPKQENDNDLVRKIFYSLFTAPLRYNKPVKVGVFGDSGEGKSSSFLTIASSLIEAEGLKPIDYVDDINVYTPIEYMDKLDKLLHNKELKKVRMIGIHEARVLVSKNDWKGFINKAVGNVNAMSRSIKPMAFFIISQFISDIDKDTRKTLNYIIECDRPIGQSTRIYMYKIWHDTRDLEHIKFKKRKVRGIIVLPNGRRVPFMPRFISLRLPNRELLKEFDKNDTKAKAGMLRNIIEKYTQSIKAKFDMENSKIEGAAEFYSNNPEMLGKIGKISRGKFKIKDEVKLMHDFTSEEVKSFGERLQEKLNKKGLI